jgi:ribosomal protein S4E
VNVYLLVWGWRQDGSCRLHRVSADSAHGLMKMGRVHTITGNRRNVIVIAYPDGSTRMTYQDARTIAIRWWRNETTKVNLGR